LEPISNGSQSGNTTSDGVDRQNELASLATDVGHESGQGQRAGQEAKGKIMPITKGVIDEWMADTGSSIDAVNKFAISKSSQQHVSWYSVPEPYLTAAGEIEVKGELHIQSEALGDIRAKLLDTDNNIVSVGQRCMDIGYDFHWPPFTPPIITRPDGRKFHCTVRHYVPYVRDDGGTL